MILIDKLCYRSALRYVNAEEKFAFAVITLLFCVISRSFLVAAAALAVNTFLTVKKGKISIRLYVRLLRIPTAFLLLGTLAILVNIAKTPLDAFAIPVGEWYITGSVSSLWFGLRLILTALAAVSCLYFLSLNTTMTDILGVLSRLHCPALLTELMLLIYRFIFLLMETASEITTAQHSRLGNKDFRTSVKSFGSMGAVLFIRAMKRSNALYDAMEARGYDGKIRVLRKNYPAKAKEIAGIVLFEAVLLMLTVLSWSMRK